jgi:hypothetical protein
MDGTFEFTVTDFEDALKSSAADSRPLLALSATHEGHSGRHHRPRQHVCLKWQAGHVPHGLGNMRKLESWLNGPRSVRLQSALRHVRTDGRRRISDVDLPTGNIERASVECCRLVNPRMACLLEV